MTVSNKKNHNGLTEEAQGDALVRIHTLYNQLTNTEKLVADYVLENEDVVYRSITEVASLSGAGYGSVVRFCKRLGYSGFQDLKIQLTKDLALRTAYHKDESNDPLTHLQEQCFEDLRNTVQMLTPELLEEAATALLEARNVLVVGFASSAITAKEIEYRLTRFGIQAVSVSDDQVQRMRAVSLAPEDVLFMVSFSGTTKRIISAGEVARQAGAKTMCLTNFAQSPVSELADIRLLTAVHIDPIRAEIVSRVPMAFVLDALFDQMLRQDEKTREILEKTFKTTADTYL
ncbi:MAG: MurR/RpiR family transcriptional regulator [Candidatus Omnitrophica bacterium]|nr:MurR/RpiR family transcriptional regulator [Candidatus Omnitrophota bacterium]